MTRPKLNLTILGVRPSMLLRFYGWRLRRHTAQELLAGGGIAVGVALVFGVLVANGSLMGSAGDLLHGLVGSARLQLVARSSDGFDERLANTVRRLPGVGVAAALLREEVIVVGPRGRESIQLIGVDPNIVLLGVLGSHETGPETLQLARGVGLPAEVASTIGVRRGDALSLLAAGRAHPTSVRAVLSGGPAGGGNRTARWRSRCCRSHRSSPTGPRPCDRSAGAATAGSRPACRRRASPACRRQL